MIDEERTRVTKQWLCNVFASTVPHNEFVEWVNAACEMRNMGLTEKNDIMIEMDPEVAKVFHKSTSISSK